MKIKVILCILIFCLAVYLFLAWPRPVNLDLKGTAYSQSDPAYTENVSIKINGQINNQYFGARGFTGQIYCEAIGLNGEYLKLAFDETNKSYLSVVQKNKGVVDYGEIFASNKMDTLVIVQGEEICVFPSANRKDAKKVAEKYFSEEQRYHFGNK